MRTEVSDNPAEHRYEIHADGQLAGFAEYRIRDGAVVFTHTEIDAAYAGKGLANVLARHALDDVRAKNGKIVPICPFIAAFVERRPEYADLLHERYLAGRDAAAT